MSSRIFTPGHGRQTEPVSWRQVLESGGEGEPGIPNTLDPAFQLAQMQQQCEQRIREAHAAGLREGEASGRSRASADMQALNERMARAIDELAQFRARMRREAEADSIKLALAIARRVLRREVAVDPEALHGLVLGALERLQAQEVSRVKVHPSHAPAVSAQLRAWGNGGNVEVVADASREPGTVVFETQRGNLDASVESQLQEIERGLADCLRRQST
jgi:flagellar assembly protein FliH